MKSQDCYQSKSKRSADARAKMFIRAHMAWLWGFPVDIHQNQEGNPDNKSTPFSWQSLYFPKPWSITTVSIDSQLISTTLRTRNRLVRDFPRALPRVVDNVQKWSEQVALKLHAIQDLLKGERVNPWDVLIKPQAASRTLSHANRLKKQHPELSQTLDQFAWWLSLDIKQLETALNWLEKEAASWLQLIALDHEIDHLLPKLFFLEQQVGKRRITSLITIFKNPIVKTAPINWEYYCELPSDKALVKAAQPSDVFITVIYQWFNRTLELPDKEQRRNYDALSILLPTELMDELSKRWLLVQEIAELKQQLNALKCDDLRWSVNVNKAQDKCEDKRDTLTENIQTRFEIVNTMLFPVFEPKKLKQALFWFASNPKILNGFTKVLKAFHVATHPDDSIWKNKALPLFLGLDWYTIYHWRSAKNLGTLSNFIPHIVHYISANNDTDKQLNRLSPLSNIVSPRSYSSLTVIDDLINYPHEGKPDEILRGIAELCDSFEEPVINADRAMEFVYDFECWNSKTGLTQQHYISYVRELIKENIESFGCETFKTLHSMADGDAEAFRHHVFLWGNTSELDNKNKDQDEDEIRWVNFNENKLRAAAELYKHELGEVAEYFATHKELKTLAECGQLLDVFKHLKETSAPHPELFSVHHAKTRLNTYPKYLHDELKLLARLHPNSQKAAARHLDKDYPPIEKLTREIDFLQDKINPETNTKDDAEDIIDDISEVNTSKQQKLKQRLIKQQARLADRIKGVDHLSEKPELKQALKEKLKHAAYLGLIHHWHSLLSNTLQQHFCDVLSLDQLAENDLGQPRHLKTLTALLTLKKKSLSVATQLLHARAGTPPWDLRDEPENQTF